MTSFDHIIFTDGACTANGKPHAKASYAFMFDGELFGARLPIEDLQTNNRGELTAILKAMEEIVRRQITGKSILIVSDSEISIKTFEKWLPDRKLNGTAHMLKNYDLIQVIDKLKTEIEEHNVLAFRHERGHQKLVPGSPNYEFALGNSKVDAHATSFL